MTYILPSEIVLNLAKMTVTVDGQPFPYYFSEAGPELADIGKGEMVPAVKLIIPAAFLSVISKRTGAE